ncbi:ABC transporter permease [Thermosipho atlanticus]|uniref:Monosaccharide ABC transporter membrane protein, CUT2 family n=1 Tax=Thermosipho atlanticus DSM 15807 TaxID=1123380 RepID=A0A1M5TW30_9BACT|nr:ABC transporter permease [Thermosipho atlanticus]SHH54820.1 monosaccharide ABC transporter membrane protein, CUT2 family [Thermosipho atlanticus DSM 15807]
MKKVKFNTQMILFLVVIALWIFLAVSSEYFLTYSNIRNIMRQMAIQGVLAVGMVVVIITAGIDLSVGSVVALVNIMLSKMLAGHVSISLAIFIVLIISTGVGLINGIVIYDFGVPAFIATLAMMTIARGATLLISGGSNVFGLPRSVANFASSDFLGIPTLFWFLIITVIVMELILRKTRFGKYVYALGSNPEAARLSGVDLRIVTYGVYALAGFLWGIGGILETTRLWMGVPTTGTGYELDAIAAAVLGGASLFGAEGSALGAFFGALVMITIYNGAVLLNINPFWQRIIVGIILVVIVAIDQFRKKKSND